MAFAFEGLLLPGSTPPAGLLPAPPSLGTSHLLAPWKERLPRSPRVAIGIRAPT